LPSFHRVPANYQVYLSSFTSPSNELFHNTEMSKLQRRGLRGCRRSYGVCAEFSRGTNLSCIYSFFVIQNSLQSFALWSERRLVTIGARICVSVPGSRMPTADKDTCTQIECISTLCANRAVCAAPCPIEHACGHALV
jgi:hypothetical protein